MNDRQRELYELSKVLGHGAEEIITTGRAATASVLMAKAAALMEEAAGKPAIPAITTASVLPRAEAAELLELLDTLTARFSEPPAVVHAVEELKKLRNEVARVVRIGMD